MDKQYFLTIRYAKAGQPDWITVTAEDYRIETLESYAAGYKQALIACGWNNFAYNAQIESGFRATPYLLKSSQDFDNSAWLKSPMPNKEA